MARGRLRAGRGHPEDPLRHREAVLPQGDSVDLVSEPHATAGASARSKVMPSCSAIVVTIRPFSLPPVSV